MLEKAISCQFEWNRRRFFRFSSSSPFQLGMLCTTKHKRDAEHEEKFQRKSFKRFLDFTFFFASTALAQIRYWARAKIILLLFVLTLSQFFFIVASPGVRSRFVMREVFFISLLCFATGKKGEEIVCESTNVKRWLG